MTPNPNNQLRVMVDANILVAGIGWPRFSYAVLQHAFVGDYRLVLTSRIIAEAYKGASAIAPDQVQALEEFLARTVFEEIASPTSDEIISNKGLVRDTKDVHVALAAMEAEVDFLISQDRDLTEVYEGNQLLHDKVKVILPAAFLRQQMGWTSEAIEQIRNRTWRDLAD